MDGFSERSRPDFIERLRARRSEIEKSIFARVCAVSGFSPSTDPEYAAGLRAAVSAALDYAFAGLERGEEELPPVPDTILGQVRLASRLGVRLDTVLRRYLAGYALLGDRLIEEADRDELLSATHLKRLLVLQVALFERFVVAVTSEHERESEYRLASTDRRRAERVRRLLDGDPIEASGLAYDLDLNHVGLVAAGPAVEEAIEDLAIKADCQLLLVAGDGETVWAWLGARRDLEVGELIQNFATEDDGVRIAFGESASGFGGWCFTHRQALAALSVSSQIARPLVRYADMALLASALRDDLLTASLHRLYLAPLQRERDGGESMLETLRAYLGAQRNVSSTSAALGVSRQTVVNRLRAIEERVGRKIDVCGAELETVLLLSDYDLWPPSIQGSQTVNASA